MSDEQKKDDRGQIFEVEEGIVVVEYYHFGENAAYEFADQVRLDQIGQAKMAIALDLPDTPSPDVLLRLLKDRFGTHQAVREFADANNVPYELKTDFQP